MTAVTNALLSWPTLGVALLIFGFAPGALLRLIVLAFHRDDPRRHELLAELYAVPRMERPFWVAQQLEVAIFEGIGERLEWAATGRIIHRWQLVSGVKMHQRHPETFEIPSDDEKREILPGDSVKAAFTMRDGWGERMWIDVTKVGRRRITGVLANEPIGIPRLYGGDTVKVRREHVIDIILDVQASELCHGGCHLVHEQCHLGGQLGGQTAQPGGQ
jgi:hypothetical protein